MASSKADPEVSLRVPVDSPGRALASARKSRSLSPAYLASRLRLDKKIIMALERDDYENLPGSAFIRGYIRSIAAELQTDAKRILDAYEAQIVTTPPPITDFSSREQKQIGSNSTIIKATSYGIAAILIILIALWWRSTNRIAEIEHKVRLNPEEMIGTTPMAHKANHYIVDSGEIVLRSNPQKISVPEDNEENFTPTTDPELSDNDPNSATRTLRISTTEEAWIEVYDLNGGKLSYDLAKNDLPVEIDSEEYYRLTLGNTNAISLHYNGREIDLDRYSKKGVAWLEPGAREIGKGKQ
tara:strand:- start:839 stop:1732 length:894 start_codon:yes stop_codon:yes gene_type:complete